METTEQVKRIYGPEIFFNFIEVEATDLAQQGTHLIKKVKNREVDGFVTKNLFSPGEIAAIRTELDHIKKEDCIESPSGQLFPAPFAIISNAEERLEMYYDKLALLDKFRQNPVIKEAFERMDNFFKTVGGDYKVSVPINKLKHAPVAAGTFRFFQPGKGGLHVHCGNLFQRQSEFYYSLIENDIDMDDQLSYFLVIQNSEGGGELTIYDMLWENVKRKESPEENDWVIGDDDKPIYLTDVRNFAVKPQPGDVLIFAGGPIWHRVENIQGTIPRITLGGFLNFSNNEEEVYYWS